MKLSISAPGGSHGRATIATGRPDQLSPRGRSKPPHGSVAELLRKMRDDAGISSGERAGALIGVTQATISRWEQGRQVPSPEDADRYARALRAPVSVRRELVAMARDRHEQYRAAAPARVSVGRSADHEKRVRRNEARAAHISVFHPLVVPGLLQTGDYVRAILISAGLPEVVIEVRVAERLARAEILQSASRQFTFVLASGVLGWCVGSPEVMARQTEHLIEMSQQPNIRIGLIPWGTRATAFPPCGFDVYDQNTVVVGVFGGSTYHNDPADVARLVAMFAALEEMASYGDDARAELRRIAKEYRRL